jgi:16S rRNA (uracil1498-N3)-methyltransferase
LNPELRSAVALVEVTDLEMCVLTTQDQHHLFRVLRTRDGESIAVTDGCGSWRMTVATNGALVPTGEIQMEKPMDPCEIFVAIPKADRPEWIVQKLTETGVTKICWLHADRSVVRWNPERASAQRERLRKIAIAAAVQSRRVWFPSVEGPVPASSVLADVAICEPNGRTLRSNDYRLAIGPEGGWSESELALGGEQISLGSQILRVETAAVVAASVFSYLRAGRGPEIAGQAR